VDCPFPPSDKIGINSVQRENEEIVPTRVMKIASVPYVPLEDRLSRIDSLKTKIFTLGCTQRRSALKHLKEERVKKFDYCMPCYDNPGIVVKGFWCEFHHFFGIGTSEWNFVWSYMVVDDDIPRQRRPKYFLMLVISCHPKLLSLFSKLELWHLYKSMLPSAKGLRYLEILYRL
ncbi:hypothetical protein ZWY2020_049585, partial [Hordeum vulgare]